MNSASATTNPITFHGPGRNNSSTKASSRSMFASDHSGWRWSALHPDRRRHTCAIRENIRVSHPKGGFDGGAVARKPALVIADPVLHGRLLHHAVPGDSRPLPPSRRVGPEKG